MYTLTKEQMIEYTAQNPFERFPDGRPKVPDSIIERAKGMSAEEVVGTCCRGRDFRNQYEDGFQVLHPGKKMVGRAFTVQFMPARPDIDTVMNAKARDKGAPRAEQSVRDRHAAAGRCADGGSVRQEGRRHDRRRQPLLLHDEGDEGRRPDRGRRDPRSGRHFGNGHAGVLPERASERDRAT